MLYSLNPTLRIERVGKEYFLSFLANGNLKRIKANPWDLLAVKIVDEAHNLLELSRAYGTQIKFLQKILAYGKDRGYLCRNISKIVRSEPPYQTAYFPNENFKISEVFTLQWHITNRCDMKCQHCYDRGSITELPLPQNLKILEDFYQFCEEMGAFGHISFSGGNPFLYPDFLKLYQKASEMGFGLSILGNPVTEEAIAQICEIEVPAYYQVSLEGLEEVNDKIRGKGHFKRTLSFLKLLEKYDVPRGVMMTLHEINLEDLIPLALYIEEFTDTFTFNRLSLVGEAKGLTPTSKEKFFKVLERFLEISEEKGYLELKDNFFNYLLIKQGKPLSGGCTGFGCGAAFNFLVLLPNGEVHACRKFPSPLGNILSASLKEIYYSEEAQRYRLGSIKCQGCKLYGLCRGCLAVTHSYNLDPFKELDPYCPGPIIY